VAQQHCHAGHALKYHPFIGQTARYTIVGAICAAATNAVLILGEFAGQHYVLMSFAAFALVTPLGYLLHCRFTFKEPISAVGFLRFASGLVGGFAIYFLLMAVMCSGLSLPVVLAAPITTVLLFIWNYASAHWAILGRRQLRL
jgi:putative flippase GtrA